MSHPFKPLPKMIHTYTTTHIYYTHTSNQPIPMTYGISLSEEEEEEEETHPIYTALRAAIEQGTTAHFQIDRGEYMH